MSTSKLIYKLIKQEVFGKDCQDHYKKLDNLVLELCSIISRQWDLEDDTRNPNASLEQIGDKKLKIDKSNIKRIKTMGIIDSYFYHNEFVPPSINTSLLYRNSETLGQLLDRLIIIYLKIHHITLETRQKSTDIKKYEKSLSFLQEQKVYLIDIFLDYRKHIQSGTAFFPVPGQVKLYRGKLVTESHNQDK